MVFEDTRLDRLAVGLMGTWYPQPHGWRWEGLARATEPLVGIILCEKSGVLHWARSDHRASDAGLPIALSVTQHSLRRWIYAGIGRPGGRGLVQDQAEAVIASLDCPTILTNTVVTGEIVPLARVAAKATLTISIVLLSRRNVRSRRLGLWSVRPWLLGDIGEPWRGILQYGRAGELQL
jgi:hypothetical protein